jgi:NAD(P)-dependent dehydrogenase (short-subunit alcohol dehydrogenase family)
MISATRVAALVVGALAWAVHRSGALWCSGRGLPIATFWRRPGFTLELMPDMAGKTVLVTGANSGLGFEVARQFARANATVILACRDASKGEAAAAAIGGRARAIRLDLSDLRQVADAAAALKKSTPALHILVNNAGAATQFPLTTTKDGVEATFQANYLGHFVLATRLLPLLEAGSAEGDRARVVHLTSGAHRAAPAAGVPLDLREINSGAVGAVARYGMAKLASLVFARELAARHPAILSNAVHPGVVATAMLRRPNFEAMLGPALGGMAWRAAQWRNQLMAYSPASAALSVLYCAASPDVERESVSGELVVPVAARWPPHHPMATDAAFGAALWRFSEELVGGATRA